MTLQLRRIEEAELTRFLRAPDDITYETAFPEEAWDDAESLVDLDKAWHAIHFTLTKSEWDDTLPAGFLLGGTNIADIGAYGPVQLLSVNEVKEIAISLREIPLDTFLSRLDFDGLRQNEIYPTFWDDPDTDADYIGDYYLALRDFVIKARDAGCGIVKVLS